MYLRPTAFKYYRDHLVTKERDHLITKDNWLAATSVNTEHLSNTFNEPGTVLALYVNHISLNLEKIYDIDR